MRQPCGLVAAFAALVLGGCASGGSIQSTVVPVRAVGTVKGTATGPQVFIGAFPVTALVRVSGDFSYQIAPTPPYVTYDGTFEFIVEPLPGREAEAVRAVQSGAILIRRAGVRGMLNAPGTIEAMRARPAAATPPAPLPPAGPAPLPISFDPCDPCAGGCCSIPILEVNPCVTSR